MYMTYSDLKRQNELLREDSAIHILNMKNKDERIKNLEKQIELWKKLYEKEKKKHNDVIDTCIEMDRFILEQDKELCDLKKGPGISSALQGVKKLLFCMFSLAGKYCKFSGISRPLTNRPFKGIIWST